MLEPWIEREIDAETTQITDYLEKRVAGHGDVASILRNYVALFAAYKAIKDRMNENKLGNI